MSSHPPAYPVGTVVSKRFMDPKTKKSRPFRGVVAEIADIHEDGCNYYLVQYDSDSDEEHIPEKEMKKYVQAARKKGTASANAAPEQRRKRKPPPPPPRENKKPKSLNTTTNKRSVRAAAKTYKDYSSDENMGTLLSEVSSIADEPMDEVSDESLDDVEYDYDDSLAEARPAIKRAPQKRATLSKSRSTKRRAKPKKDDSSCSCSSSSSSSEEDSAIEDENLTPQSKPAAKKKNKTQAADKKKPPPAKKPVTKKPMSESFKPKTDPSFPKLSLQEIYERHEFFDPCGMDDDLIGACVGEQVDRIGALLLRARPRIRLGTACSGTDAPSLGMGLVQEQLRRRGHDGGITFVHVFSCEKEPFKQAYLARNFDSLLYPDITKLVVEDDGVPKDVYGREQPLPEMTIFVAGTSCKNFSMMRSQWRLDIEDKGCSGETFLAAVEVLFKHQPSMAIFENVIGAPWGKMSQYITGRVPLKTAGSQQYIKGNSKGDLTKEPVFSIEDDTIVVEESAAVYGMRCGSVLVGFTTVGENDVDTEVAWPKGKKKSCTLKELKAANKLTEKHILVFETPCTYCTQTIKVDTKEFGLPQTRMRTYMIVWKPRNNDLTDDLGEYFVDIVNHLKSPARYSLDAFLLRDDHELIRGFREALRGPAGRQSKRNAFQEPDFWTSANANVPHNKNTRKALGLEDTTRWLTNWEPYGGKQIPPSFYPEYLDCILDMMDILYASSVRDAEMHDALHSSYFWNVSQNASREPHRAAVPGVASCITPGGDFFVPAKGRPVIGSEKLLLQGIPCFDLLMGNETEVQLGDLAGNAMSLTVVNAIMLAAVTATQLREETEKEAKTQAAKKVKRNQLLNSNCSLSKKQSLWASLDDSPATSSSHDPNAMAVFQQIAQLADIAVKTSVWCTCETSQNNSSSTHFVQCVVCRCSCCRNCINSVSGYNVRSHKTEEICLATEEHSHGSFRPHLRKLLPPTLTISEEGWEELKSLGDDMHRISPLGMAQFDLRGIQRDRKKWRVSYLARANQGTGDAVAELRMTIGELMREPAASPSLGLMVEFKSFLPALMEPRIPGTIRPCAKLVLVQSNGGPSTHPPWYGNSGSAAIPLTVTGSGTTPSLRSEVGLNDSVGMDIQAAVANKKLFKEAQARGESHRWVYPTNWTQWPETIEVSSSSSTTLPVNVVGSYKRALCRQSTNQSALWVKEQDESSELLYIIVCPNVNRTGPDTVAISLSSDYLDLTAIVAKFPSSWDLCHALQKDKSNVAADFYTWKKLDRMACFAPEPSLVVSGFDTGSNTLFNMKGLGRSLVSLFDRHLETSDPRVLLNVHSGQKAQHILRLFNSSCVASLLKFASSANELREQLSPNADWIPLDAPVSAVPFGHCEKTVPRPPQEKWILREDRSSDRKKVWERSSDPGASRKYYIALDNAPQPFQFWLDRDELQMTIKYFPEVAAHHAAGNLIRDRGSAILAESVSVEHKLSDSSQQQDPIVNPFAVRTCMDEEPTDVKLKAPFELYDRQKRAVTKMLAIENGQRDFEEIEMSEFAMPGSAGISLMSRAKRNRFIEGGVIADSIGAGKTVVSIAIILQGLIAARQSRAEPCRSSATLVLVPPALIDQWKREVQKFTEGDMQVVKLYSTAEVLRHSVQELLDADIIICPIDILESPGYLRNLLQKASGKNNPVVPTLPTYAGQVEQNAARGVWIPDSSTDPYGGGNSDHKQQRRDESAYYTSVYSDAIQDLRKKQFSPDERGIPLEYFEYERIFVDEVHESLCTSKGELKEAKQSMPDSASGFFKEKNRRAGRELLGITERDVGRRPLLCRRAIFGLTGTPLLDSSNRVVELGNLMGGTYLTGLAGHWRKLERESCRDQFLYHALVPTQTREIRKQIYCSSQDYLDVASCRNKVGDEMKGIRLETVVRKVRMSETDKADYLGSQSGISSEKKSLSIKPEDFDASAGHDISRFLRQNSRLECRATELVNICSSVLENDPTTKIIVFTDGTIGAGNVARDALNKQGLGCTWLDQEADSVQVKNEKISWYQNGDATEEDRQRPRVLVLNFAHAAGLNLQFECYNVIFFAPLYIGEGGHSSDAVADVSTELQAAGRVFRPGQARPIVYLHRIEVVGPNGEDCLDGQLLRRNGDEENVKQATNAAV